MPTTTDSLPPLRDRAFDPRPLGLRRARAAAAPDAPIATFIVAVLLDLHFT